MIVGIGTVAQDAAAVMRLSQEQIAEARAALMSKTGQQLVSELQQEQGVTPEECVARCKADEAAGAVHIVSCELGCGLPTSSTATPAAKSSTTLWIAAGAAVLLLFMLGRKQ